MAALEAAAALALELCAARAELADTRRQLADPPPLLGLELARQAGVLEREVRRLERLAAQLECEAQLEARERAAAHEARQLARPWRSREA